MDKVDLIPLQANDEKARQIISKIRKSVKSFSVSSGKAFILPPREELFSSKYHISFLELRKEGLAIEKLIKDAEKQEATIENSNMIPKYINSHFLDERFCIFTCHLPFRANIDYIQFDHSLKFGQVVAVHSDSNDIFLGMIATKLNDDVFRVFNLSDNYMFTICTSNQICPFPYVLPRILDYSNSFAADDRVIAFVPQIYQDRKHYRIQIVEIVGLASDVDTKEERYNVKFSDGSEAITEPHFLTKIESPFNCQNEQAEQLKQEYLANGIDPTVLLDPKEVRKFKQANAKKLRDMKKKAEADKRQKEEHQDESENNSSSSANKKKEKKSSAKIATRHSPRSRPTPTSEVITSSSASSTVSVTPSTSKPATPKEITREAVGIPLKLPLTPDIHVMDHNSVAPIQISMTSPNRVIQLQIQHQLQQQQQQLQQQYLFQQQMMLHHHQQPHYVQSQQNKPPISQSLTVSPTQFSQYQMQTLPMHQAPTSLFQQRVPTLGGVMRASSPNIDHFHEEDQKKVVDTMVDNVIQKQNEKKELDDHQASLHDNNNNSTVNQTSALISAIPISISKQDQEALPQNLQPEKGNQNVDSEVQKINEEKIETEPKIEKIEAEPKIEKIEAEPKIDKIEAEPKIDKIETDPIEQISICSTELIEQPILKNKNEESEKDQILDSSVLITPDDTKNEEQS